MRPSAGRTATQRTRSSAPTWIAEGSGFSLKLLFVAHRFKAWLFTLYEGLITLQSAAR
jgi:hypothetical protein